MIQLVIVHGKRKLGSFRNKFERKVESLTRLNPTDAAALRRCGC